MAVWFETPYGWHRWHASASAGRLKRWQRTKFARKLRAQHAALCRWRAQP